MENNRTLFEKMALSRIRKDYTKYMIIKARYESSTHFMYEFGTDDYFCHAIISIEKNSRMVSYLYPQNKEDWELIKESVQYG